VEVVVVIVASAIGCQPRVESERRPREIGRGKAGCRSREVRRKEDPMGRSGAQRPLQREVPPA
jgi:hypothetical protein